MRFGLKLTLAYGGGRGVHGLAYVSITDIKITINEEFPGLIFWSKRVCLGLNYAYRPESSRFIGKINLSLNFVMKIWIFVADT